MTKDLRLRIYPAVIGILSIGLLISLLSQLNKTEWNESAAPVVTELPPAAPIPAPTASASPTPTVSIAPVPVPPESAVGVGRLRVSNQTALPLRVALLRQADSASQASDEAGFYNATAHWDFAPQEGSEQGLLLSLPDDLLALKDGDIVVAFAQDGSRTYWGPFVLGRTALPTWNSESGEWELTLKP